MKRLLGACLLMGTIIVGYESPLLGADGRVDELKAQIFALAETYSGQGDPDRSKQANLQVLVEELLALSPMPPVADRLTTIDGVWKQVFGPYDYRNDDGGVDPTLGVDEIFQVVSSEGYYYNVAPLYPDGDRSREQVSLLRGEFSLDRRDPNALRVRFTDYPGVDPRPAGVPIYDLAAAAEAGTLENEITIVPRWLVRLFFGGGVLEEAYTDHDMRLVYGTSRRPGSHRFLYVMKRVD